MMRCNVRQACCNSIMSVAPTAASPGLSHNVSCAQWQAMCRWMLATVAAICLTALSTPTSFARTRPADGIAAIRHAAEASNAAAIERLRKWIAVPTIAAEGLNLEQGPEYMMALAREAGFQTVKRIPSDGVDGVFATLDVGAPRWLGIYFMYDVKQFDPSEWTSPPLEARIVDKPPYGKIMIGRGAKNQKGPQSAFLAALHAFRTAKVRPPVNIALVCEGEEEIASPHFRQIVSHPDVLPILKKSEGLYVPGPFQDLQTGAITLPLGAKGPIEVQLIVGGAKSGVGPRTDLHSSEKGRIDSPIWRLVQALATLTSADGNGPLLDGYMDDVRPLTPREKKLVSELAKNTSEAELKLRYGISHWIDNVSYQESIERLLSQPTINLQGLVGGYTGPGGKTILPARAEAKLDLRIVPNQTIDNTLKQLRAHLDKRGFKDVQISVSGGYGPTETAESARIVQAALAAYQKMGVAVSLSPRLAGSWPGSLFTGPPLNIPAVPYGLGFGASEHAPNEFLVIDSVTSKVAGYLETTMGYVELLYAVAAAK